MTIRIMRAALIATFLGLLSAVPAAPVVLIGGSTPQLPVEFKGTSSLSMDCNGCTSITGSYNVTGNALLVEIASDSTVCFGQGGPTPGGPGLTSVMWNGTEALTLLGSRTSDMNQRPHYVYGRLNPTTGTHNIVVTWPNSHDLRMSASDYGNVLGFGAVTSNATGCTGAPAALTTSLTTTAANSWIYLSSIDYSAGAFPNAGAGATLRGCNAAGYICAFDSGGSVGASGTNYSMTTNYPAGIQGISHVGVELKGAAASSGGGGGGGGGTPAAATAAGFTTVALNDDFSQPFWANKANWLDCNDGITSPPASPRYYRSWEGFGFLAAPCSAVLQENDPFTGTPALHIYWKQSFYNPASDDETNAIQTVNGSGPPSAGTFFTPYAYFEITAALVSAPTTDAHFNLWTLTTTAGVSFEWDALESWVDNGDTTSCSTGGICNAANPVNAGYPINQYHRYGWRITSDGATESWWCFYIDDNLIGCSRTDTGSSSYLVNGGYQTTPQIMIEQGCRGGSEPPGCGDGTNADVWVSRIRVFSCAAANSSAKCFSGSPNP
jgi:hypothetical protein